MSSKRSSGSPPGDRVARATALIRALAGVVDATVEADGNGIRTIAVVADPALSAWEITRNVQSALLASLGLTIDMAIVEVRRPGTGQSAGPATPQASPVTPLVNGAASNGSAASTNGNGAARNGKSAPHAGNGNARSPVRMNGAAGKGRSGPRESNGRANGRGPAPDRFVFEAAAGERTPSPTKNRPGATIARLELESHASGRVACRVVVATSDRIAAGEADAPDTSAGRLDAAARAVVAACPVAGVDLDAVRLLELAGRKYVIAAVRSWSGREMLYRAEVAPVEASAEAAAAQATLGAMLK